MVDILHRYDERVVVSDAPPRTGPARMLLVDDHELVAEALRHALDKEPDLEVVGHATTVQQGVQAARDLHPDVVLMDFHLPDGRGTEATAQIKQERPSIAVVMLTSQADGAVLAAALEAGCSGFVAKSANFRELASAIRSVLAGEVRVPSSLLEQLAAYLRPRPAALGSDLTPRELEVLRLLAQGCSTVAIMRELVVSIHTVRNHIRNILTKLNAQSRLEAVTVAARQGLISPGASGPKGGR
jgi:DNA-binding NarL/FixJ family response regulator